MKSGELFTSEKRGSDETGDGTRQKPFKTLLQALKHAGKEPFPAVYVDGKEEGQVIPLNSQLEMMKCLKCWFQEYELASQTALKKAKKAWTLDCKKAGSNAKKEDEKAQKEKEEAENRAKNLEEAKKITIVEDASKPAAQLSKIVRLEALRGQRVKVFGWVHRLRRQGNFLIFFNWFKQKN